jgi:AraC-like DNA-binding protein
METSLTGTKDSFVCYLTYSDEDEKLGMVCTDAGHTKILPHTVYPPQKERHPPVFRKVAEGRILPEFQLGYISQGEGIFESGGKINPVIPGTALLILPGVKHRTQPSSEVSWYEYWVGFKGQFFDNLVRENIFSEEKVIFNMGLNNNLVLIYEEIFDEISSQRPLYQFKACSKILALITEVLTHDRRKGQSDYNHQIVEKAKYFMHENIFGDLNISDIARQTGVSISHLIEIFKTYTSMTPYQYYIHIKILKAKSLLEQTSVSVKELAYKMGFEDQYYFQRLFKNKSGFTPSKWRKHFS